MCPPYRALRAAAFTGTAILIGSVGHVSIDRTRPSHLALALAALVIGGAVWALGNRERGRAAVGAGLLVAQVVVWASIELLGPTPSAATSPRMLMLGLQLGAWVVAWSLLARGEARAWRRAGTLVRRILHRGPCCPRPVVLSRPGHLTAAAVTSRLHGCAQVACGWSRRGPPLRPSTGALSGAI